MKDKAPRGSETSGWGQTLHGAQLKASAQPRPPATLDVLLETGEPQTLEQGLCPESDLG